MIIRCLAFFMLAVVVRANGQDSGCSTIPVMPVITAKARTGLEAKQAEARATYSLDSNNAEAIIWYGRRTAYLGHYYQAIRIFSRGILLHPADARMYRHRGHRYLSLRCIDRAITDFKKAAELQKGKPDGVEPDGMPNAMNMPTSTLQTNIWYHLGLCYYLKGNFGEAEKAFRTCLKLSKNPDMYVASAN